MRRYVSFLPVAVAAMAACVLPASANAKSRPGSPDSTFSRAYLDSDRCAVLAEQVRAAAADGALAAAAAHGLLLCRTGAFARGADELTRALRRAGLTPARPPAVVRLR